MDSTGTMTMGFDFENKLVELISSMGDLKRDVAVVDGRVATLAQKLDSHIQAEDSWRSEVTQSIKDQIANKRVWWQVIVGSLASSGLIAIAWEIIKAKR